MTDFNVHIKQEAVVALEADSVADAIEQVEAMAESEDFFANAEIQVMWVKAV